MGALGPPVHAVSTSQGPVEPERRNHEEATPEPPHFPVVGIGASAGGLEALQALTRRLSPEGTAAFVIVQHQARGHPSLLTEILSRSATIAVTTIRDGLAVAPHTVYVAPPGADVALERGVLVLRPAPEGAPRHTIDELLRSLAEDRGPAALGVILSGAGTDGTLGLRAIKEAGGITFVQTPGTAAQPGMPQSAMAFADFSLSPEEIAVELERLCAHPYMAGRRPAPRLDDAALAPIFDCLRRSFQVDFSGYKRGTVVRRLERRMALRRLEDLADYQRVLESSPEERAALHGDLLIGVTAFFRDRAPFEALAATVFPRLLEGRSPDAPIRVWVPGCATGEEAYSITMCLLECLDGRSAAPPIQVFATDIDERALARARQGIYPQGVERDVSPERLQRFFMHKNGGYQVTHQVRDLVVFARHDLGRDPPFSRLDLISCRNVLIYLQPALQRRVLRTLHYALNPDGFLLLGTSETAGEGSSLFSLVDRQLRLYTRKDAPSGVVFELPLGGRSATAGQPRAPGRPAASVSQLADRMILERFGPPGVLLDEEQQIIQFRGKTGRFLAPAPGAATLDALRVVRPELLAELRAALHQATRTGAPVTSAPVRLGGDEQPVVLEVVPLPEGPAPGRCRLVLFHEAPAPAPAGPDLAVEGAQPPAPRVAELERELVTAKAALEGTVEELAGANEELQSSNEELVSLNEELQSSNEELQSTNEELVTVNDELQGRMAQLAQSNDDLQNVLDAVGVPLVIAGPDLRIRRFSRAAAALLHLGPDDVGQTLVKLGPVLGLPQLEALVAEAIRTNRERSHRIAGPDGGWYTLQASPYRTSEGPVRGALLEFVRIPPSRRLGEPFELHELVGKVLSTLPHALLLLDDQLRLVWANKAFFDAFLVGAEVLGRPLEALSEEDRSAQPALWHALDEAAATGKPFGGLLVDRPLGRPTGRPLKVSGRCLPAEGDRGALTLVVMEEVPAGGEPA